MLANPSQVSQVGANYAAVYLSVPAPADAPPVSLYRGDFDFVYLLRTCTWQFERIWRP
jgi:hypothetical protein